MDSAAGWIEHEIEGDASVLYLRGAWRLANLGAISQALKSLPLGEHRRFVLDGSRLEELDTSAGFILYRHLVGVGCTESTVSARGFDPRHRKLLRLVHERMTCPPSAARSMHLGLVQRVGAATLMLGRLLRTHSAFVGVVVLEALALLRRPGRFRAKETVAQFEAVGLDAIPIVALVTFLIGVVFAYLLGVQAQRYGANIFVVDGVGLAVCRELSPLLAAVIVAGRSGAAFTAQLGTMKVQEEIDAISTLGLSPVQVLVIPRLAAIVVGAPRCSCSSATSRESPAACWSAPGSSTSAGRVPRPPARGAADERFRDRPRQGAGLRRLHRHDRLPHGHCSWRATRAASARAPPRRWCRASSGSSCSTPMFAVALQSLGI